MKGSNRCAFLGKVVVEEFRPFEGFGKQYFG
jgi:hypothetical protein